MKSLRPAVSRKAIIIFTRIPLPGQTKTRLQRELTPEQSAAAQTGFLKDVYHTCCLLPHDLFVFYTPGKESAEKALKKILSGEKQKQFYRQQGEGLGDKMFQAISFLLGKHYGACVLIGSDIPQMKAFHIEEAFRLLESNDVVFGPSLDGGYYLVGMKKPHRIVFEEFEEGGGTVLEKAIRLSARANLSCGIGPPCPDIDEPEELKRLVHQIATGEEKGCFHTRHFLQKIHWLK